MAVTYCNGENMHTMRTASASRVQKKEIFFYGKSPKYEPSSCKLSKM